MHQLMPNSRLLMLKSEHPKEADMATRDEQTRDKLSRKFVVPGLLAGIMLIVAMTACTGGATLDSSSQAPATTTPRQFADYGTRATPVLGIVVDKSLRVVDVDPGGVGEQAGIQRGDVLLVVGGATVASTSSAKQLVNQAFTTGQSVPIVLVRDGKQVTLTGVPINRTTRTGQPTPTAVPSGMGYDYL